LVRPLILLAALAIAVPGVAAAQTWPAGAVVVASASGIAPQSQRLMRVEIPARLRPPLDLPPTTPAERAAPTRLAPPALNPARPPTRLADVGGIPTVEIPAKAEWSDDQGLRLRGTRFAYKQRF
jgi:hypothetical protein